MKSGNEEDRVQNDAKPADGKSQDATPQNARPENTKRSASGSQENRIPAIAGLVVAVLLLAVGLWLARELTAASKMQDCVMSGRTNCNVIRPR